MERADASHRAGGNVMVRVSFTRRDRVSSAVMVGSRVTVDGEGLHLDGRPVARWRADLVTWVDEHGSSWDAVSFEAVVTPPEVAHG